jgi:hypothetical protein
MTLTTVAGLSQFRVTIFVDFRVLRGAVVGDAAKHSLKALVS